jgi:hypothetical protein
MELGKDDEIGKAVDDNGLQSSLIYHLLSLMKSPPPKKKKKKKEKREYLYKFAYIM